MPLIQVKLQAVECLNSIFRDETPSKTRVLINCISDIIPELLQGIIQGINQTENDAYFLSLETVYMNFGDVIANKDGAIIQVTIQHLVEVVNRKIQLTTLVAENMAVRCIGMIDFIIEKVQLFLEVNNLGDMVEQALVPLFNHLKNTNHHDLDNEIIDVLNNLVSRRKRITAITLDYSELAVINKMLNNDSPAVIMRCMNQLLYYGRDALMHRPASIDFVLTNLDSSDMAYMISKYYIVHSIIENTVHFLPTEAFIKCVEFANLKQLYQAGSSSIKHNVSQYGIILTGFIFKLEETMRILEERGIQDKAIQDIMTNYMDYTNNEYDRKVSIRNVAFLLWLRVAHHGSDS